MSAADVNNLLAANLIPLSTHPGNTWDWQGDTGFKASLVMDINNYVGKSFMLPLFQPVNASSSNYQAAQGNGANTFYDIVQFVGITIEQPSSTNKQIVVQPAAVVEPNAIFLPGTQGPAGTTTQIITTFTTPKLTR